MELNANMAPRVLQGRLALVTGAGQGNGRSIALGLAQAGARVVVTDVNALTAVQTAADIVAAGGQAWSHVLDVTSIEACTALAERVGAEAGKVDLLVNNAGILFREGLDSPRVTANFARTMDVNVQGSFNVPGGADINVASIAAYAGQPNIVGYSPSKGAVKMLTQSLAGELAKDGVRVNAIAPGVIETPMTTATRETPEKLERFMLRTPMARHCSPTR